MEPEKMGEEKKEKMMEEKLRKTYCAEWKKWGEVFEKKSSFSPKKVRLHFGENSTVSEIYFAQILVPS